MEIRFDGESDLVAVAAGNGDFPVRQSRIGGLHVVNFEDDAILVQKCDGKRNERVFHPKRGVTEREKENHSVVVRQMRAEHQALRIILRSGGDFRVERSLSNMEDNFGQRLGNARFRRAGLSPEGQAKADQQGQA